VGWYSACRLGFVSSPVFLILAWTVGRLALGHHPMLSQLGRGGAGLLLVWGATHVVWRGLHHLGRTSVRDQTFSLTFSTLNQSVLLCLHSQLRATMQALDHPGLSYGMCMCGSLVTSCPEWGAAGCLCGPIRGIGGESCHVGVDGCMYGVCICATKRPLT